MVGYRNLHMSRIQWPWIVSGIPMVGYRNTLDEV